MLNPTSKLVPTRALGSPAMKYGTLYFSNSYTGQCQSCSLREAHGILWGA